MKKLTAIIPTLNEESNIRKALESVYFADEIIVIDSYSTDKTLDIVKDFPVKVIQRKFDDFSSQKNYAIQKASNDWVFLLDADEVVNTKLKEEILKVLNDENNTFIAFEMKRLFFFRNKRIYFSGYRNGRVIRLFNKSYTYYEGKVHEKIKTSSGQVGVLNNKIKHFSYKSYGQYKLKLNSYAKLQAQELLEKKINPNLFHIYVKPCIRFISHLIIKLGFLDGKEGFLLSFLNAYAVKRRYIELQKLIEKKK